MQVELVKVDGKVVGWKIVAETREDSLRLGSIRQMQFWGFEDTAVRYEGMTENPEDKILVQTLAWVQKKHLGCTAKTEAEGEDNQGV